MTDTGKKYAVTNRVTGKVYTYKTLSAALRAMDSMDNAYGAVCCTLRNLYSK